MNARGLTQMTPIATEQVRRTDPTNYSLQVTPNFWKPSVAIWWGTKYFEWCMSQTGFIDESLACYNGGMRQVRLKRSNRPMTYETKKYVPKVLLQYYLRLYEGVDTL